MFSIKPVDSNATFVMDTVVRGRCAEQEQKDDAGELSPSVDQTMMIRADQARRLVLSHRFPDLSGRRMLRSLVLIDRTAESVGSSHGWLRTFLPNSNSRTSSCYVLASV